MTPFFCCGRHDNITKDKFNEHATLVDIENRII